MWIGADSAAVYCRDAMRTGSACDKDAPPATRRQCEAQSSTFWSDIPKIGATLSPYSAIMRNHGQDCAVSPFKRACPRAMGAKQLQVFVLSVLSEWLFEVVLRINLLEGYKDKSKKHPQQQAITSLVILLVWLIIHYL